jgi:hypothetical protein
MKIYQVGFNERDVTPDKIKQLAGELQITEEQLIKRFIVERLADFFPQSGPAVPGDSLDDFLVNNGALKPK